MIDPYIYVSCAISPRIFCYQSNCKLFIASSLSCKWWPKTKPVVKVFKTCKYKSILF